MVSYYASEAGPPVVPGSAASDFFVGDYAFVGMENYYPRDMERRDVFDYIKRSCRVKNAVKSGPAVKDVLWRHSLKSHFIRTKRLGGSINNTHVRDSAQIIQDAEGKTAD